MNNFNLSEIDEAKMEAVHKVALELFGSLNLKIIENKAYQDNPGLMNYFLNILAVDQERAVQKKIVDSYSYLHDIGLDDIGLPDIGLSDVGLPILGIRLPSLTKRNVLIMLVFISLVVMLVLTVKHLRYRQQKHNQSQQKHDQSGLFQAEQQNMAAVEEPKVKQQFWNSRLSWLSRIVKIDRGGALVALEEIDPSSLTDFEFREIVKSIPVSPDLVREIIDLSVNHPNLFSERIQDLRMHLVSIANPRPKPILKRLIGKVKSIKKIGSWVKNRPAAIKNKLVRVKISKPKFLKKISTLKEIKLSDELIVILLAILMILTIASGNGLTANRGTRLRRQELDSNESVYSPMSTLTSSDESESTLFHSRKSTKILEAIESSEQIELREQVTDPISETKEMAPSVSKKARTKPKKRGKTVGLSDLPPVPKKVSEAIEDDEITYYNKTQNRIPMRIRNFDPESE